MRSLKQSLLAIFTGIFMLISFVSIARAQPRSVSAEPTLWGIYGAHNRHDCPVNNRETAKEVITLSVTNLQPLMEKYGVTAVLDQYHSGLEHTFLWAVETKEPHKLEGFSIELGIARWNDLKFGPQLTFEEGVVPTVRALHGLEDWKPVIKSVPFSPGSASAEPTLWGIYGAHNRHDCPVNNRENAKYVIALNAMDLRPLMEKYGVTAILDRYHSGLEHTFLWAVETKEPHNLEEFFIELGVAHWNDLKFVPERTFEDVISDVRALHGLEDWEPEAVTEK